MHVLFGILMAIVGGLFAYWGASKSEFVVYRLLSARSRLLWGDQVHRFYIVVGGALAVIGLLWALGVIWA
jgi:hypothetical protein